MKELTEKESTFLENHCVKGLTLAKAWKLYKPDTVQSETQSRIAGHKLLQRIRAKATDRKEFFDYFDAGAFAVIRIFQQGCEAMKKVDVYDGKGHRKTITVPDHQTRIKVAGELAIIHGLKEQTVNVRTKEPLPLVVITTDGESEDPVDG